MASDKDYKKALAHAERFEKMLVEASTRLVDVHDLLMEIRKSGVLKMLPNGFHQRVDGLLWQHGMLTDQDREADDG